MPTPDVMREWIEGFGFAAKPVDVESPDEWGFLLSDTETEHAALVAFRGEPFAQLSLQAGVEVSREALEEKGSGAIGGKARTVFLLDLRLRLLLVRAVTSRFAVKPAEGGGFERIQIMFETRLVDDQISRASFYERYTAIQSAVVTAWTMFDKIGARGEWS
ncbi:hypothetical protein [Candidatus Palauibacter sp.]|uniref:hypothetical protein n=1 Tax=Candidatus Palauibacter sp. TaxID=3101350 RepID=UPI003C6FA35A